MPLPTHPPSLSVEHQRFYNSTMINAITKGKFTMCDSVEDFADAVLHYWGQRARPFGVALIVVSQLLGMMVTTVWFLLCKLKKGKAKSTKPGFVPMGYASSSAEGDATL